MIISIVILTNKTAFSGMFNLFRYFLFVTDKHQTAELIGPKFYVGLYMIPRHAQDNKKMSQTFSIFEKKN